MVMESARMSDPVHPSTVEKPPNVVSRRSSAVQASEMNAGKSCGVPYMPIVMPVQSARQKFNA